MNVLLYSLNFICLSASALYIFRHSHIRKPWLLGVVAAALLSIFSPWLMNLLGSASLTVFIISGMGVAAFAAAVFSAHVAPAPIIEEEKAEQKEAEEAPRASVTQVRYLYGAVRAGRIYQEPENLPEPEMSEEEAEKAGFAAHLSAWFGNIFMRRSQERPAEKNNDGEKQLSVWAGDFNADQLPGVAEKDAFSTGQLLRIDEPVEEVGGDVFDYENPDEKEIVLGAPDGIETHTNGRESLEGPADIRLDGDHVEWSIEKPKLRKSEKAPEKRTDKPAEESLPVVQPSALPGKPAKAFAPEPKGITVSEIKEQKPEPVTTRMGDERMMDIAFGLMGEGKWSEAADAFLRFRESAQAEWLRKQADIERLSALVHARRYGEAIDVVFYILECGYALSEQERLQITAVLRGLQEGA